MIISSFHWHKIDVKLFTHIAINRCVRELAHVLVINKLTVLILMIRTDLVYTLARVWSFCVIVLASLSYWSIILVFPIAN